MPQASKPQTSGPNRLCIMAGGTALQAKNVGKGQMGTLLREKAFIVWQGVLI